VVCGLATAVLWGLVAWRWSSGGGPGWWLPVPLALTALAVPLTLADLRARRLPDVLTLSAYPVLGGALAAAALAGPDPGLLVGAAGGALAFAAAHAAVHLVAPASLGAGDVKLSGSLGAVLGAVGWAALPVAACGAAVVTALLAAGARVCRSRAWRDGVPHGPGLLAATCLVAVFPAAGSGVAMAG
jgi:leader peptidase (prepilin peptidase)/N-methyltransferase